MSTEIHPSYDYADDHKGWATTCRRSPLPRTPRTVEGPGWVDCPTNDRGTPGWEYGLSAGCTARGFKGRASKTYYRRVRRPIVSDVGAVQS